MSDKVRVGVIGASSAIDALHLAPLHAHSHADVVAICGRTRERAEERATTYGIPQVFTDYHEMIRLDELDAVVVGAPDDLHYDITMAALDAGLHVLCEKPSALNQTHAEQLYRTAQARGVKHMVMFTWRWQPISRYVQQLVHEGFVGDVMYICARYFGGYGRQLQGWRFDGERANGILGDLGTHLIDLVRVLAGEIASVHASVKTYLPQEPNGPLPQRPANNSSVLTVECTGGAQATIHASGIVAHTGLRPIQIEVYGTAGTLRADFFLDGAVHGAKEGADLSELHVPDSFYEGCAERTFGAALASQSIGDRLFIDAIRKDEQIEPNFYDGWQAQRVVDAALESQRTGKRVSLS